MKDEDEAVPGEDDGELRLHSVGEQLKLEREKQGLELEDIATKTRVSQRHLASIERTDYGALPGRTYAVGFVRAYARAVGLNEVEMARRLREEMEELGHYDAQFEPGQYEPADPARVPPRWLAWVAAGTAILLIAIYGLWRADVSGGGVSSDPYAAEIALDDPVEETPSAISSVGGATPDVADSADDIDPNGTVVLTAREPVWLRIYNETGTRFEKEMERGESYTVPADMKSPMILTGRPHVLTVTIGGRSVAPLGTAETTIADYPIDARSLAARRPGDASAEAENGEDAG